MAWKPGMGGTGLGGACPNAERGASGPRGSVWGVSAKGVRPGMRTSVRHVQVEDVANMWGLAMHRLRHLCTEQPGLWQMWQLACCAPRGAVCC